MNPDLEKFIQPVMDNHKKGIGNRMDWAYAQKEISGLQKSDKDALRSCMIELGIIKSHPANQNAYTILDKFDFDLVKYKEDKKREEDKKWYDTENAKQQYESFPKVEKRAVDALCISKLALLISGLGFLLLLIKLIFFGK